MATIDFSTIESYVSVLFQTIEQNAFFILVGSIILYYMYQTIIGDKLVKTIKDYKKSRAMKRTNNSQYKENESKARNRLLEQYVAKDKKMKPVFKKKKPPTSTFSSRQYNPLTGSSGGGGYKPSRRQVRKGG